MHDFGSKASQFSELGISDDSAKPLLVFVHGGPGLSHHYLRPLMSAVASFATAVGYDQGSMRSDGRDSQVYSISTLALELEDVVRRYAEERNIFIFAHSFGSIVALDFISKTRLKIAGLILSSWIRDTEWLELFAIRNPDFSKVEDHLRSTGSGSMDPESLLMNRMMAYLDYYFPGDDVQVGRAAFESLRYYPKLTSDLESTWSEQTDTVAIIRGTELPILSIAGAQDRIVCPDYVAASVLLNPGIAHNQVQGGHFPFLSNEQETVKLISSFIAGRVKQLEV